ncbi:hypothetical protein JCM19233_6184 [Vibrio astriarenae]|nr:hypothetical protein JCM19233_6184 [Vibrio sp. C7]
MPLSPSDIPSYRRRKEFDYLVSGSSIFINILLARLLSDRGYSVCIINKCADKLGFEGLYEEPWFIQEVCRLVGVELGQIKGVGDAIDHVLVYAKNPALISFYGQKHRVIDFGYDGLNNYLLTNPTTTKPSTNFDEVVYRRLGSGINLFYNLLPRALKTTQLVGRKMILTHWDQYLDGWATEEDGSLVQFVTHRPNITMLFAAKQVVKGRLDESLAQELLLDEIEDLQGLVKTL